MALPDTYSELWPGRFLKADMLKGKRVTLTIKNIDIEELVEKKTKLNPKWLSLSLKGHWSMCAPGPTGFA